jgi:predicted ATPase/Tfp pilus assembly protein PilF/DNA-binding XRE family transcriptional regulator
MDSSRSPQPVLSFGEHLRRYRRSAGLSQELLAERAQLSVYTISNLERGVPHRPRKDTVQLLAHALGLSGDEEIHFLAEARLHGHAVVASAVASSSAGVPVGPRFLSPSLRTILVGRDPAIEAISDILRRDEVPLLTLVGPPGVGKTSLALAVAAQARHFTSGCVWVPLAALRDAALVLDSIAHALDLRETTAQPLTTTLRAFLRERQLLLLLDNCEQVKAAAPQIAELLTHCPRLRVLATSRTPLAIRAEHLYEVAPLPVPLLSASGDDVSSTHLADIPSVTLFVARARMVVPTFVLNATNTRTIAAICQRLDGLPLALELAASWLRVLSPLALLARLNHVLSLRTSGPQDLPERQRTLRATLAWSYELLTADEQAVFRLLAVFVGGCTLEAVEEIARVAGTSTGAVLAHLGTLVDHHLAQRARGTPPSPPGGRCDGAAETATAEDVRLQMLTTIHDYAWDQLTVSDEQETCELAHARYFCQLAETAESQLRGPNQAYWLACLEQEHDNLRAALRWATRHVDVELGVRLAGSLWQFWSARGHLSEGRTWLEHMRTSARTLEDAQQQALAPLLAKVLNGAGVLATRQSDYEHATACHEEALELRRTVGDTLGIASSLNNLGGIALEQGQYIHAQALWEESLTLRRQVHDRRATALALMNLGVLAKHRGAYVRATRLLEECLPLFRTVGDSGMLATALNDLGGTLLEQGEYARALRALDESLALARPLGQKRDIALATTNLGAAAYQQGDYPQAATLWHESLKLQQELGDRWHIAEVLDQLAMLACAQGQYDHARAYLAESLELFEAVGYRQGIAGVYAHLGAVACGAHDWAAALRLFHESLATFDYAQSWVGVASCLEHLAGVWVVMGQPAHAMRLCGAAAVLRTTLNEQRPPSECGHFDRTIAAARTAVSSTCFATAWAVGEQLPLEQIIREELADDITDQHYDRNCSLPENWSTQ